MTCEAMMKRLWWRFWYANTHQFLKPGVYYCWNRNWRLLPLPRQTYPDLVEFAEQNIVYAKDQPEYRPLPAYKMPNDSHGGIWFCWRLCWADRFRVLFRGVLWHQVLTFNTPLQPQLLSVRKPRMPHASGDAQKEG